MMTFPRPTLVLTLLASAAPLPSFALGGAGLPGGGKAPQTAAAAAASPQNLDPPMRAKDDDPNAPKYPVFGSKAYISTILRNSFDTPEIQLAGPIKLADYVVDGKIELSLRSYIELVMANNTDIQIQKLLIEPQRNAITRAFSIFDPLFTANFNAQRSQTPTTDILQGAATLSQLSQPLSLNFQQTIGSGTQITAAYRASKLSNNNTFQNFNPAYNSNIDVRFTQPLLRGRGAYITRLPILVTKSRLKAAESNLEDQLLRLVTLAENSYWDVVGARENLRVQEQALALADASLKRAQRELELGAISALEIYQPQAQYARAEIFLDPEVRKLPVVLSEPVLPPTDTKPYDRELFVAEALRNRPDLQAAITNVAVDDYNIQLAQNNLRLGLDLVGIYTTQGRGGPRVRSDIVIGPDGATGRVNTVIPGGFGDAWSQMWNFGFPVYGFGINLRLPLKDRRAAADYADATVSKRIDTLQVRRIEQNARLEVLNAISQVENSRASVDLARIAADFAQKRVEGDQKRYDLGTITLFFLLDSQNALTQAQSELVNNSVQYRRNQLQLLQRTGTLLRERGIVIR
jgi:outer membrane protein TolC